MMKVAHALQDVFGQFEKITPNSPKNVTQGLESVKTKLQNLPDLEKMFSRLQRKISSTIKQVFKLESTQLQEFNFDAVKAKLES